MGHYDIDYEYDEDLNKLSSQAFKEKWGSDKYMKLVDDKFGSDNVPRTYTVSDITELRLTLHPAGGSFIVVDIKGEPSYRFNLSTDQTNSFLIQLLNNKS